jgi:hypothetical protein
MAPEALASVFGIGLGTARQRKGLDQSLALNKRCWLATLDGVWFYQSKNMRRRRCPRQKARMSIRRLDEFFAGLRMMFSRYLFRTWEEFIGFVTIGDDPDG